MAPNVRSETLPEMNVAPKPDTGLQMPAAPVRATG